MTIADALKFMAVWFIASIPVALIWGRVMRYVAGGHYDGK